jgi:hypothetical protein
VQNVAGYVFVAFAKQNADRNGVEPGRGQGLIDIFSTANGAFHRFAAGKAAGGNIREMNTPWGVKTITTTTKSLRTTAECPLQLTPRLTANQVGVLLDFQQGTGWFY